MMLHSVHTSIRSKSSKGLMSNSFTYISDLSGIKETSYFAYNSTNGFFQDSSIFAGSECFLFLTIQE